ncbi:hypothetical protein SAMN05444411_101887 [Lutibacter oricola]|uniref:Uncharacterized protein n=1 Tax=Lutibacter oricola TaxID=762486 RepID=A0A1H2U4D8_9FLAO|nr:hypothetical protein [Lutibacter oricola]SDW51083.1 hypothetical protein SAMN05444411_101887 [Lutibacter oricola]
MRKIIVVLFVALFNLVCINAQEFTTHEYRYVAPKDMDDYINREVVYWSKFAESEMKKGNLTYWAVLKRVGGENQLNEPNILRINTFVDIDKEVDWKSITKLFPKMKFKDMDAREISSTTDKIFLRDLGNHIQGVDVVPERDFKYMRINYHNMKNTWWHLNFEAEKVKPFFKKAMDEGKTNVKGWGNSLILTPKSEEFKYKTFSYDIFSTLKDALGPNDFPDMDFPEDFYADWKENYVGERNVRIYKVIKFIDVNKAVKKKN